MGVVKNLMVRAGADFSAITTQANKAKASMSGMQTSVSRSCSLMAASAKAANKALSLLGVGLSAAAVVALAKDAKAAYEIQAEGEAKLTQVMRNTIGATNDEIKSVKELLSVQQEQGVIGDEVQLAGAQELATYVSMTSTLKKLIPVMNDMVAQQYGLSATGENATNIATMLGKVLSGQTSGLSRYGYYFTWAQEAILKYGTEAQRAATLAEVVEQSVGGMNAALAATESGRLKQVSNTLGDIKEGFGQAVTHVSVLFLPALNTVCGMLANMATLANKVAQSIANVFGAGSSAAAKAVSYTGAASTAMEGLTESTQAAGKAASSLGTMGFDTLQKMSGVSSGSSGTSEAGAGADGAGGVITETADGADGAEQSIGWLEAGLKRLKETMSALNFENLSGALDRLKTAAAPLTEGLFSGLSWAYTNIFEPLAEWTVENALPSFLGVLAGGASLLTEALSALQPMGSWLWDNFLQPLASWTGGVVVTVLDGLAEVLNGVSDWISNNQELFRNMTITVAAFFAAWEVTRFAAFVISAGGLPGIIGRITVALMSGVVAKVADVVATGKIVAAWVVAKAQWVAGKAALIAATAAQAAHTAASWAGTAATTALGVAFNVLTSPITLVIAAIAALVAGIVLLVKNWDTVKAAGSAAWDGIKSAWNAAGSWFSANVWEPLKTGCSNVMTNIKQWGSDAWAGVKSVWSSASSWFAANVTTPISNGVRGFVNGVIGFFEGMVNSGIRGINNIISAINRIAFKIPEGIPKIGGTSVGFNLKSVGTVSLPRLASGAVIPPHNEFAAILGDQTSGMNIETPEGLLREIFRDELSIGSILDLLEDILDVILSGKTLRLSNNEVIGRLARDYESRYARTTGK